MKKTRFFMVAAFVFAIGSAFVSKSNKSNIVGYQQVAGACNAVTTVPTNCTLTTGTPCTSYFFIQQNATTCISQRYRP